MPRRHQTRRPDVRIHVRPVGDGEWAHVDGLPVTRPRRIAADLIQAPGRPGSGSAGHHGGRQARRWTPRAAFAGALAPHARPYGFRQGDGLALLRWLLDLTCDPERDRWADGIRQRDRDMTAAERYSSTRLIPPCADRPAEARGKGQPLDAAAAPASGRLRPLA